MKILNQKGAVLVLTALMLPLIICVAGTAVDLGNIYIQHSRLQNAADAAALAGANAYAKNNETVAAHPKANETAAEYISGKYHNLAADENISEPSYQARKIDSSLSYYRVKLQKEVDLYFLKLFTDKTTFSVTAASVASIINTQSISTPSNLFLFEKEFDAVNSLKNPDKLTNDSYNRDSKNMISTAFDGKIHYTDRYGKENKDSYSIKNGDVKVTYSSQSSTLDRFFTSSAMTDNKSQNISNIMEKGHDAEFSSDGTPQSGYYHYAEFEAYDYKPFLNFMKDLTANADIVQDQNLKTSSQTFASDYIRAEYSKTPNLSIEVDKTLGSANNSDEPIYIYINTVGEYGGSMSVVNINLNADTGRPLIICLDGNPSNRSTQVHFNLNGYTFKGIIFTPYSNEWEGVLVNAANSTFYGSIYAGNKLSLRGDNSKYIYKDFFKNAQSSAGSTLGKIGLVSGTEVSWD